MINYNDLKKGLRIILDKQPYEITECSAMFKGRGHSVFQSKLKNLTTNEIISRTFHPSDSFKEAEISKIEAKFLYSHKDKFIFSKQNNPSDRFELSENQIGTLKKFLKPNQIIEGLIFNNEVINISLPVKIELKVKEAPPGIKGDRSRAGNKLITLETGAELSVPLFIEEGDIIEINTEKNEYVKRVK